MAITKRLTLRQAREAKGWSQSQLATETQALGSEFTPVDQRNISKIERGEVSDPQNSTVTSLETALGLRRGTLVFGVEAEALAS